MRRVSSVGAGLVAIGLAGCVPFPHCERIGSELLGRLNESGRPLVGIRVKRVLGDSTKCSSPGDEAVTDSAGQFSFPSETRFRAVIALYGDPWAPITLCAERGNEWLALLDRSFLGSSPPPRMQIVCDIRPDAQQGRMCVDVVWWAPTPPTPLTDPNHPIAGMTMLMLAAQQGDLAATNDLLANGADLNLRDDFGGTALLIAIQARHDDVAMALIAAGADPNAPDDHGLTPWLAARAAQNEALVHALENAGAIRPTPVPYRPLPTEILRP